MKNKLLEIAESLEPKLIKEKVQPIREVKIIRNENAFQGWKVKDFGSIEALTKRSFKTNDSFTIDFGNHQVGYIDLSIIPIGSHQDAPLRLKLKFGEMPCEIGESFENYNGWLSKSWLQEETINIDVLPSNITLRRRYAFRYLRVDVIATSQNLNRLVLPLLLPLI
jgi:alpha-L-rhamnosidase